MSGGEPSQGSTSESQVGPPITSTIELNQKVNVLVIWEGVRNCNITLDQKQTMKVGTMKSTGSLHD